MIDSTPGRVFGIPADAKVVLVSPGGSDIHSEARAPILDLLLGAFDLLDSTPKYLVWVASGADHSLIAHKCADRLDIILTQPHYDFGPPIAASDVVITKGNRLPLFECEVLNIPSISISHGHNAVDDYRVSRITTNIALRARGLTKRVLAAYIDKAPARSKTSATRQLSVCKDGRTL